MRPQGRSVDGQAMGKTFEILYRQSEGGPRFSFLAHNLESWEEAEQLASQYRDGKVNGEHVETIDIPDKDLNGITDGSN